MKEQNLQFFKERRNLEFECHFDSFDSTEKEERLQKIPSSRWNFDFSNLFGETHNLRYPKITAFKTDLCGNFFAVIDTLVAVASQEGIFIYKWTPRMKFKKVKLLGRCFFNFVLLAGKAEKSTAEVLLKALLFAWKEGVKNLESFMSQLVALLKVENIVSMHIAEKKLYCVYKNMDTVVYDNFLFPVAFRSLENHEKYKSINYSDMEISLMHSCVIIDRKNSVVEEIFVGNILQYSAVSNFLFLLVENKVLIFKFAN